MSLLDQKSKGDIARVMKIKRPVLYAGLSYHRTHRGTPIDFKNYPYIRQIYAEDSKDIGIIKATQSGISEYLLCRALSLAESGRNIFYVLPMDRLIGRFVKERLDKTVKNTNYYSSLIVNSENSTSNVTMKQIGAGTIVFAGSNSTASFVEFPADDAIIDENDRCDQTNLLMVDDRLANSEFRTKCTVGQPTITDYGIHQKWKDSKQWLWRVKCPHCSEWIHPSFLDHVVVQEDEEDWTYQDVEWSPSLQRDPFFMHCGKPFNPRSDGMWIATYPSKTSSYYHIGKEFSTRITVREMCEAFDRGLSDDSAMMRFYNSDLGLPYTPKGSKLSDRDLDTIVGDYIMPSMCERPCVMGIDVGSNIHIVINEILGNGTERMVWCGFVRELEDIISLTQSYNIICGVIDANPELRLSRAVSSLPKFFRCYFHADRANDKVDPINKKVNVNRTEILDSVIAKIRERRWMLPRNAKSLPEFYDHMLANTRIFNENKGDSGQYEWVGTKADHLMFASVYATIARRIVQNVAGS